MLRIGLLFCLVFGLVMVAFRYGGKLSHDQKMKVAKYTMQACFAGAIAVAVIMFVQILSIASN